VGEHRRWYRYHPLLRETLLHELRTEDPALHRELHRRAARWFADNAEPVQALRHATDAQDWVLVGELFVTVAGARILSADRQAMNEALARIPDAELLRTAALSTCAAAKLEYAGRFAEIPAVLTRGQRMLATTGACHLRTRVGDAVPSVRFAQPGSAHPPRTMRPRTPGLWNEGLPRAAPR